MMGRLSASVAIALFGCASVVSFAQRPPILPGPRVTQTVADREFSALPGFVVERLNPADRTDSYVVLTFDAEGRPVVAKEFDAPRRLLDRDGDGIYESEQVISEKVSTCQGLWVDGTTVYGSCMPVLTPEELMQETAEIVGLLQNQGSVGGSRITGGRGLPAIGATPPGGGPRGAGPAPGGPGGRAGGGGGRGGNGSQSGLFKMTDADGDGVAEATERIAYLPGSIEDHGAHALRRGSDGTVMYITGNNAGSPINQDLDGQTSIGLGEKEAQLLPYLPNFGTSQRDGVHSGLYRVDLDARKFALVAGGNRNTYDFAYNLVGEAFWFDSDMEPELGVPWYREVRTVHGIPGGNYGYRNGSGKYPHYYIDSLPPVRDLNRGSPVGVETYQAYAYPREYFDNLFEADWSRGRLLFTALTPSGATYSARTDAGEFLHGEPLNITDVEVGPDGMLYFTTGGRGTEGGFWRIRYTGAAPTQPDRTGILAVVRQPQPLSSWGWAAIERVKATMGAAAFGDALEQLARNSSADATDRMRALFEMQRHGVAPSDALLQAAAADAAQLVRAAAVYLAGLKTGSSAAASLATNALRDGEPLVRRRALEAIVRLGQMPSRSVVPGSAIYPLLNDEDRFVRWSARVTLERTNRNEWASRVMAETNPVGVMEGMLAWVRTAGGASLAPIIDKQFSLMDDASLSTDARLRVLRTFHVTMTESPAALTDAQKQRLFSIWAARFPATNAGTCEPAALNRSCAERLNREIALTLAYSDQPGAISEILAAMPPGDTEPALQLHYLYALRTIRNGWTPDQKNQLVTVFDRASRWRGGMYSFVQQMWDESMEFFFAPDEREAAAARATNLTPWVPLPPVPVAAAPGVIGGPGRGGPGGGGGGRGGRGPGQSKQEVFEGMLYVIGRGGGGGRGAATPVDGAAVFQERCAECHRFGAVGTDVGGDLTGTQLSRREILESLFWPEARVDPKYASAKPMPDYFELLSQAELGAVTTYLMTGQ